MKKEMLAFLAMLNCRGIYSGKWPTTLFIYLTSTCKHNKDEIMTLMIKRFTRHTQIKFIV